MRWIPSCGRSENTTGTNYRTAFSPTRGRQVACVGPGTKHCDARAWGNGAFTSDQRSLPAPARSRSAISSQRLSASGRFCCRSRRSEACWGGGGSLWQLLVAARPALSTSQHNPSPERQCLRRLAPRRQGLQFRALLLAQRKGCQLSTRHRSLHRSCRHSLGTAMRIYSEAMVANF